MYLQDMTWGNGGGQDTGITRMLFCSLIVCGMGMCVLPAEYLWFAK